MRKLYLLFGMAAMLFAACEKDQIGRYDLDTYVYFTQKETEVSTLSFYHHPGVETYPMEFEVNLMGHLLTEDKEFSLYIDEEKTTATPDMYELNMTPVFHKGTATDKVTVTLKNPDNILDDKEVTLVFGIQANEHFEPGFVGQRSITIQFNNKVSRPEWWNETVENYLGAFDPYKYTEFIKCIGGDIDLSKVDETQIRSYALQFKQYIKDNGLDIELPVY